MAHDYYPTSLRLKFADKDAEDVAHALLSTQGGKSNKLGGLCANIVPQYLQNDQATKENIFSALDATQHCRCVEIAISPDASNGGIPAGGIQPPGFGEFGGSVIQLAFDPVG